MNEGWKRFHGTDEEVMWRIQVLKRTLAPLRGQGQGAGAQWRRRDGDMPAMDHASLMDVLKRIDNVMEWRFVNALGEVVLDADILAESIDCETLRSMRQCVVNAIVDIEEAEEGRDE